MIDEKKLIEELEEQYKNLIPEDDWDYCKIRQIKADIKVVNRQPVIQQGIDKDRLIEFLQNELKDWNEMIGRYVNGADCGSNAIETVLEWVTQQPTSDGWIPVSSGERLTRRVPEKGEIEAIWYGNKHAILKDKFGYAEAEKLMYFEDLAEQGRLAYLPQPYKESEEE